MKKILLSLLSILFIPVIAWSATYYVRPAGAAYGTTSSTCNGTVDIDSTGSNGPGCAVNHPFWFTGVDPNCGGAASRLAAGDTLIIHPGPYSMGLGAPNTSGVESSPWDCHMRPLVSGTDSTHKTKIYGSNYASCPNISSATELYGVDRTYWVIDLQGTNNFDIQCLNITDHSQCRYNSLLSDGDACTVGNVGPFGSYAIRGVKWSNSSGGEWHNSWVHGVAAEGVSINNISNALFDNFNTWGNAGINMNFNGTGANGTADQATGTITLKNGIIAFAGCTEAYPPTSSAYNGITLYDPRRCCSQDQGCASDGLGTNSNGADWVIDNMTFIHNVADGLDLLYKDQLGGSITIKNTKAIDNSGNQIKGSGIITVDNTIVSGNCNWFAGKAFTWTANGGFSDHCRAGGNSFSFGMQSGTTINIRGTTLYDAQGAEPFSIVGRGPGGAAYTCTTGNTVNIKNDVVTTSAGVGWINKDSSCSAATVTQSNDAIFGILNPPTGATITSTDPLLTSGTVNGATVTAYLSAGSPAIGLGSVNLAGQPTTDINGYARGAVWDAGALEFGSVTTGATCDTDCTVCTDQTTCAASAQTCYFYSSACHSTPLPPTCGDGIRQLPEECDDGNTTDGDCCSSICQNEVSGVERFLQYVRTDPNSNILTIQTHSVLMSNQDRNSSTNLGKDFGPSHFGNFTATFQADWIGCAAPNGTCYGSVFAMSTIASSSLHDLQVTNLDGIDLDVYQQAVESGGTRDWSLTNDVTGAFAVYHDTALPVTRYVRIIRNNTALTADIYSDSSYSTLLSHLAITIPSTSYRFLYPVMSYNDGNVDAQITTRVSNLKIGESVLACTRTTAVGRSTASGRTNASGRHTATGRTYHP